MKTAVSAKVVAQNEYGYLLIEQQTEGWAGSRFKDKETNLRVRRVDTDGDDHVQIEVTIREYHNSGATRAMHSSVTLSAEALEALVKHLAKPWEGVSR